MPLFTPLYLKKPVLAVIPHLFGSTVYRETNPVFASYVYFMERPIPRVFRHAVIEVISESTAADIVGRGVKPEQVRVVHCGMDHDTYNIDPAVVKFEQKTVLYVGRIKKYKSVDVIIRAMPDIRAGIPDARLVVVGSGDNLPQLKRLAGKLGIGSHVDPTKSDRIVAIVSQIPCPMLGSSSSKPASTPMASANGSPITNPPIVKMIATTRASNICPLKKAFQLWFISFRSLLKSARNSTGVRLSSHDITFQPSRTR